MWNVLLIAVTALTPSDIDKAGEFYKPSPPLKRVFE